AFAVGEFHHTERLLQRGGDRLFTIDVLAGVDGPGQQGGARLRGRGIEEDGVVLVRERLVEIGAPARDGKLFGETRELAGVAAEQDRIRHDAVAAGEQHPALVADRDNRADQVLVQPHPAGDPIHDQAEALDGHAFLPASDLYRLCPAKINLLDKYCPASPRGKIAFKQIGGGSAGRPTPSDGRKRAASAPCCGRRWQRIFPSTPQAPARSYGRAARPWPRAPAGRGRRSRSRWRCWKDRRN